MRRRAFLANVAALAGLGAADAPAAIGAIRQELNQSLVEERAAADVDEWQEIALEYGGSYPVLAPAELIKSLTVDLLGLQLALRRHTQTMRLCKQSYTPRTSRYLLNTSFTASVTGGSSVSAVQA